VRSVHTAAVLALLLVVPMLSSCASSNDAAPATTGSGATCSYPPAAEAAAKKVAPPSGIEPNTGTATVTLSLTGGNVTIAMDKSNTPCTVGSFVHLVTVGYFDGTPCHRLTTAASLKVLQCGDPTGKGSGGPGYQFDDETDPTMKYPAGTVAMANSGPNTNGSQFFLVYGASTLPPSYTVFGKITGGLPVLTKIASAGVTGGGSDGAPTKPILITKATAA